MGWVNTSSAGSTPYLIAGQRIIQTTLHLLTIKRGKFVLFHPATSMVLKLQRGEAVTQHAPVSSVLSLPVSTNTDEVLL